MLIEEGDEDSARELRDYLQVLRRRKAAIALPTVLFAAGALIMALAQTPVYAASAKVLVQPVASGSLFEGNPNQGVVTAAAVETELEVLTSAPVEAAVHEKLGFLPPISASGIGETSVILVQARSTTPSEASKIANAYADAYIEYRRKQAVDNLLAAGEQIQSKVTEIQSQIDALDRQINAAPPPERDAVRQNLDPQRRDLVQQQGAFKERIAQAQVDSALATGRAQVVKPASAPRSPVSPKPVRDTALGLLLGLVVGLGLAFLREHLDDSIKSKDDFDRAAKDVPVVAVIPAVTSWKAKGEPRVVSIEDPRSPAAEAYRTASTALKFLTIGESIRVIQVTSPGVEEGKSTTIANLAVALAGTGYRVLIVCCDLRRPRIHKFFNLDNSVGLTSVLLGEAPLTAAQQPVPGYPGLSLLASGPPPPNPAELLSSFRVNEVFACFSAFADVVLVDSPPILPVSDAMILSSKIDATLLACYIGKTTRKEIVRAVELLRQVDAPLIGSIINGMRGGSSYYYYYYQHQEPPEKGRRRGGRSRESRTPEQVDVPTASSATVFREPLARGIDVGHHPHDRVRRKGLRRF